MRSCGMFLGMSALSMLAAQQPRPGSVPGVSDAAAIIIGTVLTLLVIYAIVAAHLRKED